VEIANGTKVCSNCNWLKNLDKKSVGRLIDQIVIKREGQKKFDQMKAINLRGGESQWKNMFWLEEKIKELETYIAKHKFST
jgi:flagellar basal body P-ring protein FlgI